jgi:hypothetical protein
MQVSFCQDKWWYNLLVSQYAAAVIVRGGELNTLINSAGTPIWGFRLQSKLQACKQWIGSAEQQGTADAILRPFK